MAFSKAILDSEKYNAARSALEYKRTHGNKDGIAEAFVAGTAFQYDIDQNIITLKMLDVLKTNYEIYKRHFIKKASQWLKDSIGDEYDLFLHEGDFEKWITEFAKAMEKEYTTV